ncbi:MAG: AlpA family phage regulatory protein [Methylobacter sp.]|nr:AlpA family phage regulatory protein [Methylobacter sp.]
MKRVLKCNQAATMAGVSTRSLKGLMETDNFPMPIMVGKAHGWIDTEIQAWIDQKIADRDAVVVGGTE